MSYINIWIYPTRACNLRCSYCYEEPDASIMPMDVARAAVDWVVEQATLAKAKGVGIFFFGGEPLLAKKILRDIVEYASTNANGLGLSTAFRMNTNGTLLDDDTANFLIENRFVLDISLDGDREVHDLNRKTKAGKGSYDLIGGYDRIFRLIERGLDISVNMVVGPDTVSTLASNVIAFWDKGIFSVQALPVFEDESKWTQEKIKELDQQLTMITTGILRAATERHDIRPLRFSPFSKIISGLRNYESDSGNNGLTRTYCGIGRTTYSINTNGDIYSCPRLVHDARIAAKDYVVGNVLKRVYNRDIARRFREWNPRIDKRCRCSSCRYVLCCPYQCAGQNLSANGSEFEVSGIVCKIMDVFYQHSKQLRDLLYPASESSSMP